MINKFRSSKVSNTWKLSGTSCTLYCPPRPRWAIQALWEPLVYWWYSCLINIFCCPAWLLLIIFAKWREVINKKKYQNCKTQNNFFWGYGFAFLDFYFIDFTLSWHCRCRPENRKINLIWWKPFLQWQIDIVWHFLKYNLLYPPQTKFGGVYRNHLVRLSVCPSVCLSVCPASCPEHNFWTVAPRIIKLGMWMHHGKAMCRILKLGHCDLDFDLWPLW